jgi:tRNA G18 (ribose-2'-O)-methylase SpoU
MTDHMPPAGTGHTAIDTQTSGAGAGGLCSGNRGYFAVVVYRPKTTANVGSLWRSAHLFGAAFIGTVGHRYMRQPSDTVKTPNSTPLVHYADLEDLLEHLPHGCPLVGVELDPRAVELQHFQHPDRALYLLGAEDDGIPPAVMDRCHHIVQIPTAVSQSMNVACAGSVILSHRHMARMRERVLP